MQKPLILASKSPRRAAILRQIGIEFIIKESNFKEEKSLSNFTMENVRKLLQKNASGKALAVASQINEGVVIGADTLVIYKDIILGKPKDEKDALRMLLLLQGTTHYVCSGIALVKKTKDNLNIVSDCDVNTIYMRNATEDELKQYIKTKEPMDKAGAYGAQESGAIFIKKVEGDFTSIVGLPVNLLIQLSRKLHIDLWNQRI